MNPNFPNAYLFIKDQALAYTVSSFWLANYFSLTTIKFQSKVTVQFKTEGNGQNEIVSYMDRSEVKLLKSKKIL